MLRALVFTTILAGCGGPDLYRACGEPADCDVPDGADAVCLDKSGEGFCSWRCDADTDCSDDGDDDVDFVCASFESDDGLFCFPSCEDGEGDEACPPGYGCRSTGGGNDNRKICFPEG